VTLTDLPAAFLDHLPHVEVVTDVLERTVLRQAVQKIPSDLLA